MSSKVRGQVHGDGAVLVYSVKRQIPHFDLDLGDRAVYLYRSSAFYLTVLVINFKDMSENHQQF